MNLMLIAVFILMVLTLIYVILAIPFKVWRSLARFIRFRLNRGTRNQSSDTQK